MVTPKLITTCVLVRSWAKHEFNKAAAFRGNNMSKNNNRQVFDPGQLMKIYATLWA